MLNRIRKLFAATPATRQPAPRARLSVEPLEDRRVMATLTGYLPSLAAHNVETGRTLARSDVGTMVEVYQDTGGAISARLFNSSGGLLRVVSVPGTNFNDSQPTVAMSNNGQFVVAWTDNYYGSGDLDVRAQLFNSSGFTVGGTIWVAASTHNESQPSAGMDTYGNFAVAYTYDFGGGDNDVYVTQFNASGSWVRSFGVAQSSYVEEDPSLDMNILGQFVVAYNVTDYSSGESFIYASSYTASGALKSYHVELGEGFVAGGPSAAIDVNGNYAVAATGVNPYTGQASGYVFRVNSVGSVLSSSQVGQTWTNVYDLSIDMSLGGQYVVSWVMDYSATDQDVYAQQFNNSGVATGGPFAVANSGYSETNPTVAMDSYGNFTVGYFVAQSGGYYQAGRIYSA
jgi:hypothetical protein